MRILNLYPGCKFYPGPGGCRLLSCTPSKFDWSTDLCATFILVNFFHNATVIFCKKIIIFMNNNSIKEREKKRMFGIFISILKKFNNNFILFLYFYYNVNTKNY